MVRKPRSRDGAITVIDPDGIHMKIPLWMVSPQAEQFKLSKQAEISTRSLLSLLDLLESFINS